MKEVKISYLPRVNNESGTVHRKTFAINNKILEAFYDILEC